MTSRLLWACPAALLLLVAVLTSAGCGGGCTDCGVHVVGGTTPVLAPDFLLADDNPNSATYQLDVSPREYNGQVSAWYFGFAT